MTHCSQTLGLFPTLRAVSRANLLLILIGLVAIDCMCGNAFGEGFEVPPGALQSQSAANPVSSAPTLEARVASLPSATDVASSASATRETPSDFVPFDGGEIIAVIGEEYVLAGDVYPFIDSQLREIEEKVPSSQLSTYREKLTRQSLVPFVQNRLLAQLFINDQMAGKPLNERQEAIKQMDTKVTEGFFTSVMPHMMEKQKVETQAELDKSLREEGTSLNSQFRVFKYTAIAQESLKQNIPKKFEVHLDEMREYYDSHIADFQRPARVRFRELAALFSKCATRAEAGELIVKMGNEVYLGGTSFESAAKRFSQGVQAAEGGVYDWLSPGSLKSKPVEEVVFSIPLRQLSAIIEDADGLKIVEVMEREAARLIPFEEAQSEIREKIIEIKRKKATEELMAKLKENTSIWSKWPEDIPGARPLAELGPAFK